MFFNKIKKMVLFNKRGTFTSWQSESIFVYRNFLRKLKIKQLKARSQSVNNFYLYPFWYKNLLKNWLNLVTNWLLVEPLINWNVTKGLISEIKWVNYIIACMLKANWNNNSYVLLWKTIFWSGYIAVTISCKYLRHLSIKCSEKILRSW